MDEEMLEVTVCQQCGDKGASTAWVYCVKCLEFAIHRYCLDVLPDTFDEFVPWFCEDCKPDVPSEPMLPKVSSMRLQEKKITRAIRVRTIQSRRSLKTNRDANCLTSGKEENGFHDVSTEPDCECVPSIDSSQKDVKEKKMIKEGCPDKEEQRHKNNPSGEPPNACANTDSSEHSESDLTPKRKRCRSRSLSSQGPREADKRFELTKHAKLVSDCFPIKMETSKNPKDDTGTVAEAKERMHAIHGVNGEPQKAFAKMDSSEHSESDLILNRKRRRSRILSSQGPRDADERLESTEQAKLVSDCSHKKAETNKEMKDDACKVLETVEQMHAKEDIIEDNVLLGDYSPTNRESILLCRENDTIDLQLEKEKGLMIENGREYGNEVSRMENFADSIQYDHHGLAQPVIDPIWRGSFDILNKEDDTFEGFVYGHVSSKACLKVCEEASLLPSSLCLEMHPISVLWPKSFQESEPSDDNIALYFFPADREHERVFDDLVEDMKEHELAMRAVVKNAELLIFTSTELPISYWRFQGKYYLWGVFKGKKCDSSPPVNHPLPSTTNDVPNGQRTIVRMKTLDAQSPLSPLSNMGEHVMDMEVESGE